MASPATRVVPRRRQRPGLPGISEQGARYEIDNKYKDLWLVVGAVTCEPVSALPGGRLSLFGGKIQGKLTFQASGGGFGRAEGPAPPGFPDGFPWSTEQGNVRIRSGSVMAGTGTPKEPGGPPNTGAAARHRAACGNGDRRRRWNFRKVRLMARRRRWGANTTRAALHAQFALPATTL